MRIDYIELQQYMVLHDKLMRKKVKSKYFEYNLKAMGLMNMSSDRENLLQAEELLHKALNLTANNQYARSSACHELGVFYYINYSYLPGSPYQNLQKSESYLKRAISYKKRRKIPERYASSLSQLGVVYRRAAVTHLWPDSPTDCLQKAEYLNRKSITCLLDSKLNYVKLSQSVSIYFNLANVLFDREKTPEACDVLAQAFDIFLKVYHSRIPNMSNDMDPMQALGVTFSRLNYFSKEDKHKKLCEYIISIAPEFGIDPIVLMNTNPTLDISNPTVEILYLFRTAIKDASIESERKLRRKISNLMQNRQSTESDQESDSVTALIQLVCSGLARVLVEKGNYLEALVELENVSAMRFCEGANKHWHIPTQKMALSLVCCQQHLGSTYYALNELSLMVGHLSDHDDIKGLLSESADALEIFNHSKHKGKEFYLCDTKKYAQVVRESSKQDHPKDYLQNLATVCMTDFQKFVKPIDQLDPDYAKKRMSDSAITANTIEVALRNNPDTTLLKIDIEDQYDNVVILVASMKKGKVVTNGFTFKLPKNLVNGVNEFVQESSLKQDKWLLDFIDWKQVLPIQSNKVALLTSFFASHIPWGATGNGSERLLDLVDEINWLPTIMYLCNEVTYFNERESKLSVLGGRTQFNQLAHQNIGYCEENRDKINVIELISKVDVFSYYGHCEHNHPDRPSLLFDNFTIKDVELIDSVSGVKRVEFWACQSGSNIPSQILGSPVNEAFGMDMKMLQLGANTALGTLWAVPEFVTAHIKQYYDVLVSKGMSASKALLAAQRWWINDGADQQVSRITELGMTKYLDGLGYQGNDNNIEVVMGPVFTGNKQSIDTEALRNNLKHPSAWAGLRFCGLPEKKSKYIPQDKIDLNADEKVKIKSIIEDFKLSSGFIK